MQNTVVLQEVTPKDVVSLVDAILQEVHCGDAQRGMECPADGRCVASLRPRLRQRKDENFNVDLTFDASLVKVRSDLFVLPEATPSIKFTLGMLPDLASRDFCVLVTLFSHTWQFIAHCVWQQPTKTFWTRGYRRARLPNQTRVSLSLSCGPQRCRIMSGPSRASSRSCGLQSVSL